MGEQQMLLGNLKLKELQRGVARHLHTWVGALDINTVLFDEMLYKV